MRNILKFTQSCIELGLPVLGCSERDGGTIYARFSRALDASEQAVYQQLQANFIDAEYSISPDKQSILSDGVDIAVVMVSAKYIDPLPGDDVININGDEFSIELVGGVGELEFISTVYGTIIYLEYHGQNAIIEVL